MRIFRNKKTGKRMELDEKLDTNLIKDLEKDGEYQELLIL